MGTSGIPGLVEPTSGETGAAESGATPESAGPAEPSKLGTISVFSTQNPAAEHTWPPRQSVVGEQVFRQVLSARMHSRGVGQPAAQACIWHTAIPSTCTHLSPEAQSLDFMHALWHAPNLHCRPSLQSLFRLHEPPSSSFLPLPQAARAQAKQIKDATRTVFIAFSFEPLLLQTLNTFLAPPDCALSWPRHRGFNAVSQGKAECIDSLPMTTG
jgi:hypothetical protein